MIGWHGTDGDFEAFDEAWFGSNSERAPNGRLGVWVFLVEGHAAHLGMRVLEVEADVPDHCILRVTNERMVRDHQEARRTDDPHAYYDALRARMRAEGYQVLVVRERDGTEAMGVVLDLDCITRVTELAAASCPR